MSVHRTEGQARSAREYRAALESAAAALGGHDTQAARVWYGQFLGPDCLPCAHARALGALDVGDPERDAGRGALEGLLGRGIPDFVQRKFGSCAAELLTGLVRSVQAATAATLTERDRYRPEAVAAYQRAFAPLGDDGLGEAMVSDVVERLQGAAPAEGEPVRARILLDDKDEGWWVDLAVTAVPAGCARLLPDPLRLGLTDLEDDFLRAVVDAWKFLRMRHRLEGIALRWGWSKLVGVPRLTGRSGGCAFAAAARAALEGVHLDERTAVSAAFSAAGALGPVGGVQRKCRAARQAGCALVLFWGDAKHPLPDVPEDHNHARPVAVSGFEDAWAYLRGLRQALEAYARAEQACILDRARRFRSPRLDAARGSQDLVALVEQLHVPFNVLTRVWTRVRLPRDEEEAFLGEMEWARGDRSGSLQGRAEQDVVPPGAPERLSAADKEHVLPFDREFEGWCAHGQAGTPPVVVLGDPGYGKSWLTGVLSLRLLRRYLGGVAGPAPWLPLRVTCQELAEALAPKVTLADAVAEVVVGRLGRWHPGEQGRSGGLRVLTLRAFADGRVLLLADGWDEAQTGQEALRQALVGWGGPLLVTSRVLGRPTGLQTGDRPWMLTPLDVPQGIEQLVRGWFGPDASGKADRLLRALASRPQLQQLVRVPLLAVLVCWLWDRGKLPAMPVQPTLFLQACLVELVAEGCREATAGGAGIEAEEAGSIFDDVLLAVAGVAFRTFTGARWTVSQGEARDALSRLPPRFRRHLGPENALLKALTGRFGLFTEAGRGWLEILHQSFAEFLCAWWIARTYGRQARRFLGWLRDHGGIRLLDLRWHEVWVHLAALLPAPSAEVLLRELWTIHERQISGQAGIYREPPDDLFDTALCLVGHCLAAAAASRTAGGEPAVADFVSSILTQLVRLWTESHSRGARDALVALGRAGYLPYLFKSELGKATTSEVGKLLADVGSEAVSALIKPLADTDSEVRRAAARALAEIHPAEAAVPILVSALADPDSGVRRAAAWVLREIGPAAGIAVPALIKALADADSEVRWVAAEALGRIGATEAAVPALVAALADVDSRVRRAAAWALAGIGPAAGAAGLVLVSALADPDSGVRQAAAWALEQVGLVEAAVLALIKSLTDADNEVRQAAAEALGRNSAAESAAPALIKALADADNRVRQAAAEALAGIGPAAGVAVPGLIKALADADSEVRRAAVEALCRIGPKAVPILVSAVADPDSGVRRAAAEALGRIGATEAAVPALVAALADVDSRVRRAAAWALAGIGPAAGAAGLVLVSALADPDSGVRQAAAEALEQIGPAAVSVLVTALADADSGVRQAAAEALERIGPLAVPELVSALADADSGVRRAVTWALAGIGPEAKPAVPALVAMLADADSGVRQAAVCALEQIGPAAETAVSSMISLLSDADSRVRWAVAKALAEIGPAAAVPVLVTALADADSGVRQAAAEALERSGRAAVPVMVTALADADSGVRQAAARALGRNPVGDAAVPMLVTALTNVDSRTRHAAAKTLGRIGAAAGAAVPELVTTLSDLDSGVRQAAAEALEGMGPAAGVAVPGLIKALADADSGVRWAAAKAVGRIGATEAAVPVLMAALANADSRVRQTAAEALGKGPPAEVAVAALVAALADRDDMVRWAADRALLAIVPPLRLIVFKDGGSIRADHVPLQRSLPDS